MRLTLITEVIDMKSHYAVGVLVSMLALVLAAACGGRDDDDGRLRVVATTTQIGDFARNVGGDRISLTVLLRPTQDAHDFSPSPSQIRALQQADVILRNGIGLDTFVERSLDDSRKARVTIVSNGVSLRKAEDDHDDHDDDDHDAEEEAAGNDPHVWLSVANAKVMVENIRDALARADAANADFYRENARRYLGQLDDLDRRIRAQVAEVPEACRKLVTNHDVLGYYSDAYGFRFVGAVIPSVSTDAQPSASDVANIVRKIREENVPAIFAESSANPRLIQQVGREANVKVVDDLLGDSLAARGRGSTYIGMMEQNTQKIVDALKGC
jgi:zinc/manganese transport system substrate-binding protein